MKRPNQDKLNFLIEEYRMLRTEIESYSKQKRQLEISVITAILFIYGFVATANIPNVLKTFILTTPVIVVLWGVYRFIFYNRVIRKEVQYVKDRIEPMFLGSEGGWETFWEKSRAWGILTHTEFLFWVVVLILTLAVPFVWPL